mgnify:CR=1 FL=1
MAAIHEAMRSTRGAVAALAEIDEAAGELVYTGVGNISAAIFKAGQATHLVSVNGIVGHRMERVREFRYPWSADSTLVMNSDGLKSRWSLYDYPGLAVRSASLIAATLFHNLVRRTDDASVAVFRQGAPAYAA